MYDKASIALIPSGYKAGSTDNLYSVLPANGNGDFNATRGSTATRVNKDGLIETVATNVPRLDYPLTNGVVGDCPHLLLEPSRTNLYPYSNFYGTGGLVAFSGGTSSFTATNNYAISLDGTQNAIRFEASIGSTSSDRVGLRQLLTMTATDGTLSFYGKSNTSSNQTIAFHFNGATRTVVTLTNEWQRFTFTDTSLTVNNAGIEIRGTYTDTSVDVLLFGFQMEQASYATSYIPTENDPSGVTRSADVCNSAGTSAEFNDSEGVLFAEIASFVSSGTSRRIAISDGAVSGGGNNRLEILYSSSTNLITFQVFSGGVFQGSRSHTVTDITDFNKVAVKYKQDDFALWINSVEVATMTSGNTPTGLNTLRFEDGSGGNDFYGKCKQLIYFNEALSDSELQTLTS